MWKLHCQSACLNIKEVLACPMLTQGGEKVGMFSNGARCLLHSMVIQLSFFTFMKVGVGLFFPIAQGILLIVLQLMCMETFSNAAIHSPHFKISPLLRAERGSGGILLLSPSNRLIEPCRWLSKPAAEGQEFYGPQSLLPKPLFMP